MFLEILFLCEARDYACDARVLSILIKPGEDMLEMMTIIMVIVLVVTFFP